MPETERLVFKVRAALFRYSFSESSSGVLRLIVRITSGVQASFILYDVFSGYKASNFVEKLGC